MKKRKFRIFGAVLIFVGTILFVALGSISAWGDIEATFFNAALKSETRLSSLRCPAIITPRDDAYVSARIDNTSSRELEMETRTYVSDGYVTLMKEFITNFDLKPGESEVVRVPIGVDDAAYNMFVLVRMHQMKRGSLPYLNASCGVFSVNLPWIKGTQLITLVVGLGLLLSVLGLFIWIKNIKPVQNGQSGIFRALVVFQIVSFLNLLAGLFGLWALAVLLLVIWILLGIAIVNQHILKDTIGG
ncbi:MAG: hypothetical protein ACOX7C_03330 [Brevefilum sp.]|jgi:hypothetical protein